MVLRLAQNVFLPLVIAWILSYLMVPGIRFMTRLKVPVEVTTCVLLALLLLGAWEAGGLLSQMLLSTADMIGEYGRQLAQIWARLSTRFNISSAIFAGINWNQIIRSAGMTLSGSVLTILSKSMMVIVFLMFILFGSPYVEVKMRRAFPRSSARVLKILDSISMQIGRFLALMTLISGATGLCIWLLLSWIGVDFASTWGVLAFFLNFIPTVGSIVASIPPILVSIVQFFPTSEAVPFVFPPQVYMTVGAILLTQVTIGNIITPKVMGDSMNLSPVMILVSLLMWGWIWGVAGALLAMPIAGIIKIICDNVDPLNTVGVLMSSGKLLEKDVKSIR